MSNKEVDSAQERQRQRTAAWEPGGGGAVNLAVDLGGLAMRNPLTVASGTFAAGREYAALWQQSGVLADGADSTLADSTLADSGNADDGNGGDGGGSDGDNADGSAGDNAGGSPLSLLGALTTKGVSAEPWLGNPGVRVAETASGMLNSIGLQNPGVEEFCAKELPWLAAQDVPVIVNVSGHSEDGYRRVIERLEREKVISAYEVNISCPNVDCGGMAFGTSARAAERVTSACRAATGRPLIVKLTPNVTDITEIARACEAAGADALSLINTVAGMAIDARTRRPVFERVVAGLSGPAIKPVALYAVYRVHRAVGLPLVGMGGVTSVADVVEFLLAGATAVAIGTQNFVDPLALPCLLSGLRQWCEDNGVHDVRELTGGLR